MEYFESAKRGRVQTEVPQRGPGAKTRPGKGSRDAVKAEAYLLMNA